MPVGLPVVEDTGRLVGLVVLLLAGELLGVVVETGVVLEPIAEVGAVIKLCSVWLKVPVIPLKLTGENFEFTSQIQRVTKITHVNLAEKPWYGYWPTISPKEVKRRKLWI